MWAVRVRAYVDNIQWTTGYIRYKNDGDYEKVQRRLILMNLNEAFQIVKEENPAFEVK